MKSAAEFLTSVTLELGGKSPVIVDRSANLAEAAKKIAWGKFFNSGQICIAPDYLLVEESVRERFLELLRESVEALGNDSRGLLVNERHAARVRGLIESALAAGARTVMGGASDGRHVEPTVLADVPPDAPLMREEIFGPVLPVVSFRSLDEAIAFIQAREKPLVLYLFTRTRSVVREVLGRTRAGGTVVNHAMIHFYELSLPFGGVGESGFGRSHGFHGFEAFSNPRGVLEQVLPFSAIELLFPPYVGRLKQMLIDFTVRWL
jgi:aldehyde dehydrogenase (NAD+)